MRIWCLCVGLFFVSVSEAKPPISICTNAEITQGIDVSDNQENTNWSKVAGTGIRFTFVKATEGITFLSSTFFVDWTAAKAAGLKRSAYHYFQAGDDGVAQAQAFLKALGTISGEDLPPMLDWEDSQGETPKNTIRRAQQWLETVQKATGQTPIIYTNPGYWRSLGNPAQFAKYPLFVVDIRGNCPEVPAPWKQWTFWQYQIDHVFGVNGNVDLDAFNGSLTSLVKPIQ